MWRLLRSRGARVALAGTPFVYEVLEQPNRRPADPLAERHCAEKSWLFESSAQHRLHRLHVATPGLTYITFARPTQEAVDTAASSDCLGELRVMGDTPAIVECVEVVQLAPNGLDVRFKPDCADPPPGHLLTELVLYQPGQVYELLCGGGGTFVVDEHVLVTQCPLTDVNVTVRGSGKLFVLPNGRTDDDKKSMHLKRLNLSVEGSGEIQLAAHDVKLDEDARFQVAGKGAIHVVTASFQAAHLKSSVAGSGKITTSASNLVTGKLKQSIAGSGTVSYATHTGSCDTLRVAVAGTGTVHAPNVTAKDATMVLAGQADVVLRVTDSLKTAGIASGKIKYVDATPKVIKTSSMSLQAATPEEIEALEPVATTQDVTDKIPLRTAAFDEIKAVYEPIKDGLMPTGKITLDWTTALDFVKDTFFGSNLSSSSEAKPAAASSEKI